MINNKQPERKKYQRYNWPMHIKQWQESGLTQSEYCRKFNINATLLLKNKKLLADPKNAPSKFIKIPSSLNLTDSDQHEYEIILPGNIRIRINNNFNPDNLKNLMEILKAL